VLACLPTKSGENGPPRVDQASPEVPEHVPILYAGQPCNRRHDTVSCDAKVWQLQFPFTRLPSGIPQTSLSLPPRIITSPVLHHLASLATVELSSRALCDQIAIMLSEK
jgi:hypothetical protein